MASIPELDWLSFENIKLNRLEPYILARDSVVYVENTTAIEDLQVNDKLGIGNVVNSLNDTLMWCFPAGTKFENVTNQKYDRPIGSSRYYTLNIVVIPMLTN